MSNPTAIRRLHDALTGQTVLAGRGYSFDIEESTHALVARRGDHVRGVWRCADGEFTWTPPGYAHPTHRVADVDSALRYTVVVLATAP